MGEPTLLRAAIAPSRAASMPAATPAALGVHHRTLCSPAYDSDASMEARTEPRGQVVSIDVAGDRIAFQWGQPWQLGTCAYWAEQTRRRPPVATRALGDTLAEEIAACMLGGHGIPADIGLAAYAAVRRAGLLADPPPTEAELHRLLSEPMRVPGRSRPVRYRFATQRARRLAAALEMAAQEQAPQAPLALRDWLQRLPGIGPKTASWVVRNRHPDADVAIVDVHVQRAGVAAGFFSATWALPRDYPRFESAFCAVSRIAQVSPADLDACVWDQLQSLGRHARLLLPPAGALAA